MSVLLCNCLLRYFASIDDVKNQIANVVAADSIVVIGIFGSEVNVPCKPSARNFSVRLFRTDDRVNYLNH